MFQYGTGSSPPVASILEVRFTNECSTSPLDGNWYALNTDNTSDFSGDLHITASDQGFYIIGPNGSIVNAGTCSEGVNDVGSYLTHYREFNFKVEVRIKPGMEYTPGKYELTFNYWLVQN